MPATTPALIARAIIDAVTAARAEDPAAFTEAALSAAALDQATLSIVQAGIIHRLLEITHPDGLDAEDVQDALTRTVKAATWCPGVAPDLVAEVLVGSLGLTPRGLEESTTGRPHHALGRPAMLVIATLLADQPTPLPELIAAELAELERAQTIELP